MKKKREFGELESTIFNLIKNKKRATVADIHKMLKKEIAYTTVMTVIDRLFKKKYLKREKENRSYVYFVCATSKSNSLNILTRIKNKIFLGSSLDMITYLLEDSSNITLEELEKVDYLIKQAKKNRKK